MILSLQEFISNWSTNYPLTILNKANRLCQKKTHPRTKGTEMKTALRPRRTERRKGTERLASSFSASCYRCAAFEDPDNHWVTDGNAVPFSFHENQNNSRVREEGNWTEQEQGWGASEQAKWDNKWQGTVAAAKSRCAGSREPAPGSGVTADTQKGRWLLQHVLGAAAP